MSNPYQKAYFLLSVAANHQLPPDVGREVAIVGRSNAGKSSVINTLTRNKRMARVSKTPGRTQLINIFVLDEERRLADLPGYGFAKAPPAVQAAWEANINEYIQTRESLFGLVVVMDIRHPMRDLDQQLLEYCETRQLPVHILLNKADKISKNSRLETERAISSFLTRYNNSVTFQSFSVLKQIGLLEFQALLDTWYDYKNENKRKST